MPFDPRLWPSATDLASLSWAPSICSVSSRNYALGTKFDLCELVVSATGLVQRSVPSPNKLQLATPSSHHNNIALSSPSMCPARISDEEHHEQLVRPVTNSARNITPPSHASTLPPSPPATDERAEPKVRVRAGSAVNNSPVLRFLEELGLEKPLNTSSWIPRLLRKSTYEDTLARLQRDDPILYGFITGKIRHDVGRNQIVLRMPAATHEFLAERVKTIIQSKLQELKQRAHCNDSTKELVDNIISGKSTRIKLEDGSFREPDEQFILRGLQYPGVVLEVANTQKARDLSVVADDFLVESGGDICTVIGLRIAVGEGRRGEVQVWKPKYVPDTVDANTEYLSSEIVVNKAFRNDDGTASPGDLRLKIKDFGPESVLCGRYSKAQLDEEVSISFEELADALTGSEADSIAVEGCGDRQVRQTKIMKRKRDQTPEEILLTDDEDLFRLRETKIARQEDSRDRDYRSSSV